MSEQFTRKITFKPAFDRRHTDPHHNYGIHCVDMYMVLIGEKGAISFTVFTGWFLPEVQAELKMRNTTIDPTGAELAYHSNHSKQPIRDWQKLSEPSDVECCWLGVPCWSDGSALQADRLFEKFVREGDEAVWKEIEKFYHMHFDDVAVATAKTEIFNNGRTRGFVSGL